jgi:HEAT repeat protein
MSLRQGNLVPEACTFWRNDAALRRDSITALFGWIHDYIPFMLNTLISDLRSPDPLVRVQAAPRLGDLGAAAEAIPSLLSLTKGESQHPLLRVLAASAVSRIDPAQTGAVIPVLINALKSDDAPLQGAAADELGALGPSRNSAAVTCIWRAIPTTSLSLSRRPSKN